MTPKEKAKELVDKMYQHQWRKDTIEFRNAKQCALIAVDELIKMESMFLSEIIKICDAAKFNYEINHSFWQDVKNEIEKL